MNIHNSSSKLAKDTINQPRFNYGVLDRETQILVKQRTSQIKGLIRQTARDIIEVGQLLAEVKDKLQHGQFRNWLKTEFNWSVSSATKFMQVSKQFKSVNFTHFHFATSALYLLAAPSTPESARQQALELASQGENITYSLAKMLVNRHKQLIEFETDVDAQKNQTDKTITRSENQLESQVIDVIEEVDKDCPIKKNSQIEFLSQTEQNDTSVRIVEIKYQKPIEIEKRIQDFEIIYADTCVAVEGHPEDLTILFKQMQNNPQFAEDVFRQAKLLSDSESQFREDSQPLPDLPR